MFDFRLQVFRAVARRLSFTKAAAELFITQPAVTRHIHELENQFKLKLFERSGSRISLTVAGETLLQHTENIFAMYHSLEFDMNNLADKHSGLLRIGASTTVAQYVIPPVLADFHKKFKQVNLTLDNSNTEHIEQGLLQKGYDLGIVEGRTRSPSIRYTEFIMDHLVLVCNPSHPLAKKDQIRPEELKKIPLLLREPGSGTLEVVLHALKGCQIKRSELQVEMQLGSSESIKSYLKHSNCMAFLSVHAIQQEMRGHEYSILPVKGLVIQRPFYFIQAQGSLDQLATLFIRFAKYHSGSFPAMPS